MQRKLSFLIIDDSAPILAIYTELLQQSGHTVTALTSCDDALEYVKKLQPDCVLCDLIMPGLDSLQLYKNIRQAALNKQPAFIVISGKQFEYDRRSALDVGVDAYFTKPINHATFVAEVTAVIDSKLSRSP